MRILVCLWDFFGGGAERVAVLLANALADEGADVTLYCALNEGPNLGFLSPRVHLKLSPGKGQLAYFNGLRALVHDLQPDIVQSHLTTRNVMAMVAHLITKGRQSRRVFCVEHGEIDKAMTHIKSKGRALLFQTARFLYPLAHTVLCVSQNVKQSVDRFVWPFKANTVVMDNPVVFQNMIDMSYLAPQHPWLVDKTMKTLVTMGRLEAQKNHLLLIDAIHALRKTTNARLIIFGEGTLRREIEAKVVALGLSEYVQLPGYTQNPFSALRHSDLFVLSSEWEGLPTVAIEALACGVAVVSTDNSTGIRQILANHAAGLVVPKDDPGALAAAIEQQLAKPTDANVLSQQVRQYEAGFIARKHMALYE